MNKIDGCYDYYAFISYNHKDKAIAKWLQNSIERYNLPSKEIENNSSLPDRIRPLFRDITELSSGILSEEIHNALTCSKFLILLCSPDSAHSAWCNKEIDDFIKLGRGSYIIPVIVNADNTLTIEDTYCPCLKAYNIQHEILAINLKTEGREVALIKVISRLLDIRFDVLWRRHEKAQKKKQRLIISGVLGFAFLSLVVSAHIWNQSRLIKQQSWHIQSTLARAIAANGETLIDNGDIYTAIMLGLAVVPTDLDNPDKPNVIEIEKMLRRAHYNLYFNAPLSVGKITVNPNSEYSIGGISRDESYIWEYDWNDRIAIYETKSLSLLHQAIHTCSSVWLEHSFSPDGKLFVSSDSYNNQAHTNYNNDCNNAHIVVWDVASGKVIRQSEETYDINEIAFSADGDLLFVDAYDYIYVLDYNSFGCINKFESRFSYQPINERFSLFSGDYHSWILYDKEANFVYEIPHQDGDTSKDVILSETEYTYPFLATLGDKKIQIIELPSGKVFFESSHYNIHSGENYLVSPNLEYIVFYSFADSSDPFVTAVALSTKNNRVTKISLPNYRDEIYDRSISRYFFVSNTEIACINLKTLSCEVLEIESNLIRKVDVADIYPGDYIWEEEQLFRLRPEIRYDIINRNGNTSEAYDRSLSYINEGEGYYCLKEGAVEHFFPYWSDINKNLICYQTFDEETFLFNKVNRSFIHLHNDSNYFVSDSTYVNIITRDSIIKYDFVGNRLNELRKPDDAISLRPLPTTYNTSDSLHLVCLDGYLFDLGSYRCVCKYTEQIKDILELSDTVALCQKGDYSISLFDNLDGHEIWNHRKVKENFVFARYSPSHSFILVLGDNNLLILDSRTGKDVAHISLPNSIIEESVFAIDDTDQYLVSCNKFNGDITVWDITNQTIVQSMHIDLPSAYLNTINVSNQVIQIYGYDPFKNPEEYYYRVAPIVSYTDVVTILRKRFKNRELSAEERQRYYVD